MGSCVSKKAARAGADRESKAAAPLPPVKEINTLSPVAEEEEEVKEVVLSETPAPRLPPVKKRQQELLEETGSSSEGAPVVAKKEKVMAKAGGEQELVKRAAASPEKARARRMAASPDESKPKPTKQAGAACNGRARSPSPRRPPPGPGGQQQQLLAPRPRREPAVVSGIGCRSGRFSPSAARRAAESAVRRTHSAREADMALSAKRSLSLNPSTNALSRRDPGERSGRRADSPTASKRPSPSPSPIHRQARRAPRESCSSTPERSRPRVPDLGVVGPRDAGRPGDEEQPAFPGGAARGAAAEHKKPEEVQNPSVAMECFIFL